VFNPFFIKSDMCCHLTNPLLLGLVSRDWCSLLADSIRILVVLFPLQPPSGLLLLPNKCSGKVDEYFEGHASIRIFWDSNRVERS
jgi:hypothetical protein